MMQYFIVSILLKAANFKNAVLLLLLVARKDYYSKI